MNEPIDVKARSNDQARYVEEHTQCAMCATQLEIDHDINAQEAKVTEEARCVSCGIRVRAVKHRVH